MKKYFGMVISIVLAIVAIIVITTIENSRKTPKERFIDSHSSVFSNSSEKSDSSIVDNKQLNTNVSILNTARTVEYEFLSCDIVNDTDIDTSTEYLAEYFDEGVVPDPDYLMEYVDYEQIRADYPNVDEYISSNGANGMTASEYQSFLSEHIQEYTTYSHPQTQYVFIRCTITNIDTNSVAEHINDLHILLVHDGEIFDSGSMWIYFDNSQHIEGNDRYNNFFLYSFESGEVLECVIGCEIIEGFVNFPEECDFISYLEECDYYIGFIPYGVYDCNQLSPATDDGFVQIDVLPEAIGG